MSCDLFIIAGEKSGDLHGDKLIGALLKQNPNLKIAGVGGSLMRKHPFECVLPTEKLLVMGFIDVILALPKIMRNFYKVARAIFKLKPKAVITIDYPGFNLRLAKHLKRKGFDGKLIHFICPSVWAWGKKRIPLMENTLDQLLCILPFEKELFDPAKLPAYFVGNPVKERVLMHDYAPLDIEGPLLSFFPGSRKKEIERNLPLMLQTAALIRKNRPDIRFALCISGPQFKSLINSMIEESALSIQLIDAKHSYELMKASSWALAKSGTVTLELALHKVPTVVMYAISKLDQFIAYHLLRIRLPFYCLVNIIAGKEVFKEAFGAYLTPKQLADHLEKLFESGVSERIQTECALISDRLGEKVPSEEAASHILSLIT